MTHQNLIQSFLNQCGLDYAKITDDVCREVLASFIARYRCDPADCVAVVRFCPETLTTEIWVERRKPNVDAVTIRGTEE